MAVTKGVRPKKVPMRQCMGCGEKKEKKDLIRIIRTPDEEIVLDVTGKKNGRMETRTKRLFSSNSTGKE